MSSIHTASTATRSFIAVQRHQMACSGTGAAVRAGAVGAGGGGGRVSGGQQSSGR